MPSSGKPKCLLLTSNFYSNPTHGHHTRRAEALFAAHGIPYYEIDGANEDAKDLRDQLFTISGHHGIYPQFFFETAEGEYDFIGLWDDIEALNENADIPEEYREQNPDIRTFMEVFGQCRGRPPTEEEEEEEEQRLSGHLMQRREPKNRLPPPPAAPAADAIDIDEP